MNRSGWLSVLPLVFLISFSKANLTGQTSAASQDDALRTAEGTIRELYSLVTFDEGTTPDWDRVRSLFLAEAVVVLRTSRETSTVFSVDGFIADFVRFIEQSNVEQTGFQESVVRTSSLVFRDLAHVLVLYEASIPGSERAPQQGVDSFQLIQKDGRWWIVSITNDLPTRDHPVPEELRGL
jgi:hypothetical protein